VVDIFTNISLHKHGPSVDILGRAYKYCFGKFAGQEASWPANSTPPRAW
jgi:hypothetical protein